MVCIVPSKCNAPFFLPVPCKKCHALLQVEAFALGVHRAAAVVYRCIRKLGVTVQIPAYPFVWYSTEGAGNLLDLSECRASCADVVAGSQS